MEMFYEAIVVGGDLASVVYAFANNLPIIFTKIYKPYPFEYFNNNFVFPPGLCFAGKEKELVNQNFDIETYHFSKRQLFEQLLFSMSSAGLVPFSSFPLESIFYQEDGSLRVVFKGRAVVTTVRCKELRVFNPELLSNLPISIINTDARKRRTLVVDWGIIKGGGGSTPPYDVLRDATNRFVEAVYFFPSCRVPKNKGKANIHEWAKDLLCVSRLTDKELPAFRCSIGMAAKKAVLMMNEYGIKGKWRDKYVLRNHPFLRSTIYYQKPEVKIEERETRTLVKPRFENFGNVVFCEQTEEKLLASMIVADSCVKRLNASFWRTKC
jgi:hypothetical protein